ncbi:hypothetical protein CEW87_15285 [Parazoarcus communis]|uniref:Uncharacterized protein n=1 Tax=Parazoarcus communis TaxID=41977 RepID=A0A2U8H4R8_9RHOO|nr:hypothetical protein [Parazoarcus communis]AWI80608.1 hypothetical protein CEW87_15285 [Parazoarcus communis]
MSLRKFHFQNPASLSAYLVTLYSDHTGKISGHANRQALKSDRGLNAAEIPTVYLKVDQQIGSILLGAGATDSYLSQVRAFDDGKLLADVLP